MLSWKGVNKVSDGLDNKEDRVGHKGNCTDLTMMVKCVISLCVRHSSHLWLNVEFSTWHSQQGMVVGAHHRHHHTAY